MPCEMHLSWSPGMAYAVSAMMGTGGSRLHSCSFLRMNSAASYPSRTGMLQSMKTRSKEKPKMLWLPGSLIGLPAQGRGPGQAPGEGWGWGEGSGA